MGENTIIFENIDSYKAVRVTNGTRGITQAYSIYNSAGDCVAFLGSSGWFHLLNTDNALRQNNIRQFHFQTTGIDCDNDKELEQVVRYAYLLTQKIKSGSHVKS